MELLKLFMLAGIATLCSGQNDTNSTVETASTMLSPTTMTNTIMITPTPSSTMDAVSPSTVIVTATRVYRDLAFYQQIYFPNGTSDSVYQMAAPYRYSRYNCLERDQDGNITNRVPGDYVLTVFLQMPVLHFLELRYKIRLMESIRARIGISDTTTRTEDPVTFTTPPEICIDGYDQAFVGSFDEGIMLRIYQRPESGMAPNLNGEALKTRFDSNAGQSTERRFEGLPAIEYGSNERAAVIGPFTWPGRVSINIGGCRQLDYRNSFFNNVQLTSEQLSCRRLDTDEQNDIRDELAENPDPINFYLEAGDYVFAVLGSIVVAIVLGLATLGYCIHPFFLA